MYVEDSWKYSFCQSFRKQSSYKSAMIILYHTSDITKFQTLQRTVDSYFIAGFVLSRHWRISRQI